MTVFSVVVATYGRGPAIAPTLQSIADQTLADLEVLVVSDGPAAAGLAETVAGFGPRFALHELPSRTRSQSGPNNRGLALARGEYVAYLGHDDLWLPEHLDSMAAAYARRPDADFVVAGCLYLGPPGQVDELTWVSGLFGADDAAAPTEHFFPPSSVAQRRTLPAEVAPWPEDAAGLRQPVDTAYLLGAAAAGCRFVSTGRVSAVKFASALRYLSYLAPSDAEQRRVARLVATPESREAFVAERVEVARERGNFMTVRHADAATLQAGEALARNEAMRGISLPAPAPLTDSAWLEPGEEWRGFDWHGPERQADAVWRWSGPSERPRLAIPFTHVEAVHLRIHLRTDRGPSAPVTGVLVDGVETAYAVVPGPDGDVVELLAPLRDRLASVIELETGAVLPLADRHDGSSRLVGVALSGVELETHEAAALRDAAGGTTSRAALEARLARLRRDHDQLRIDLDRAGEELALTRQHAENLEGVRGFLEQSLEDVNGKLAQAQQARRRAVRRLKELGQQE